VSGHAAVRKVCVVGLTQSVLAALRSWRRISIRVLQSGAVTLADVGPVSAIMAVR
jgi:hypothetical protein